MTNREIWEEVYIRGKHKDPHAEFADRLGLPRQEAKVLCYRIMYEIPFLVGLVERVYQGGIGHEKLTSK